MGLNITAVTSRGNLRFASILHRTIALFVDLLILGAIDFLLNVIFNNTHSITNPLMILVSLAYFTILQASKTGASFGKDLLLIKVVAEDGKKLTMQRSVLRTICFLVLLPFSIIALFTKENQALHDIIAKTRVVYK